jgi:hypothetical protein
VIFVRRSRFTDGTAIAALAALSGKKVGRGPFLLAEVGGKLVAATSLDEGELISDPFEDTEQVEDLLTRWAASLRRHAA